MEQNKPTNEIMTHEEMETNIQRFMQIRNDFYDAIKEIKPNVMTLQETNKSLVAHFEVLRQISEDAEKNIHKTIQSSSKDMAQAAGKELAPLMEESLKSTIKGLDRSVLNAKDVLEKSMGRKYIKLVFGAICGCLLFGPTGYAVGYSHSEKNTPASCQMISLPYITWALRLLESPSCATFKKEKEDTIKEQMFLPKERSNSSQH